MKKNFFCIFLFLSVFIFVFISHKRLMFLGNEIINHSSHIEYSLNSLDTSSKENPIWNEVYIESLELHNNLLDNYGLLSLYLNHEVLDYLDAEMYRLSEYTKIKDLAESRVSLSNIHAQISVVISLQKLCIRNIM